MYNGTTCAWDHFGDGLAIYCIQRRTGIECDHAVRIASGLKLDDNPYFREPEDLERERNVNRKIRGKHLKVFQIYGHWKIRSSMDIPDLADLLFSFEDSECHHWQDKIYGLLGLVEGGEKFSADYSESRDDLKKRVVEAFAGPDDRLRARLGHQSRLDTALRRIIDRQYSR